MSCGNLTFFVYTIKFLSLSSSEEIVLLERITHLDQKNGNKINSKSKV